MSFFFFSGAFKSFMEVKRTLFVQPNLNFVQIKICYILIFKRNSNRKINPATDLIAIHNGSLVVSAEEPHLYIWLQFVVPNHLTKPRDY